MRIEKKTEIVNRLKKLFDDKVEFAFIFGSIATGRFYEHSDIDAAVYLKEMPVDTEARLNFISSISKEFNRKIDLIILNDCDIVIAMQVLANGILIINNNPHLFIRFKARKLSEYPDFKISRRIVEERLLNGRIYA